ncbi:MAG: DUF2269 family protein [Dehalococcoidia bacterium]|nr:DUF2269 family protein [Dehalococcoidia bacterium]
MSVWRALHTLALFWMMAGIGNVVVPVWKAWRAEEIEVKALLITDAERNEGVWLLPGMLASGLTGFAWAAAADWDLVRTGWLVALEAVFALDLFIFLPLLGVGLRRVRLLALQAKKQHAVTPELRDALADNVPLVFGTLIVFTVPLMVWLAVFKPF